MKVLKIAGIAIAALVLIVLIWALTLPSTTVIERSTIVEAKPAQVFNELNSFKNFNEWSPWFKIDPNTKYVYEGPESGVGAKMSWKSDHQEVGSGAQWIVESKKNEIVKSEMSFGGFEGKFYAYFKISPEGENGTNVTWGYEGSEMGLIGKIMVALLVKSALGKTYEDGLASFKIYVESKPEIIL